MTEYYKENIYNEYAIKKEDRIIAIVDSGSNARKICNELNELNNENEILKKELKICKRDNKDLIEHISDISSQINVVVFSDHMKRYIPPKR